MHQTTGQRPCDLLKHEQLSGLDSIRPYQWIDREPRVVTSEAMVLYHKSHYSVPAIAVGQKVVVEAQGQRIAIRLADTIIAEHRRAEKQGQRIELEAHTRERWYSVLTEAAQARTASPTWYIGRAAPSVQTRPLAQYEEVAP